MRETAGVLRRQQDLHDQTQREIQVVGRQAGDRPGRLVLSTTTSRRQENAGNSGNYTPGQFPDNVTSLNPTTRTGSFSPSTRSTTRPPQRDPAQPDHAAALHGVDIAAAGGPHLDYTDPANAKRSTTSSPPVEGSEDVRDEPVVADRRRPVQDHDVQREHGRHTSCRNPPTPGRRSRNRRARQARVHVDHGGVQRPAQRQARRGFVDSSDIPQVPIPSAGLQRLRLPGLRVRVHRRSTSRTPPGTGTTSSSSSTSGRRSPTCRTRTRYFRACTKMPHRGIRPGAGDPGQPVRPGQREDQPVPVQHLGASSCSPSHGWTVYPNGTTTCTEAGHGREPVRRRHSGRHAPELHIVYSNRPPSSGQQTRRSHRRRSRSASRSPRSPKTFNYIIRTTAARGAGQQQQVGRSRTSAASPRASTRPPNNLFNTGGSFNQGGYSDPTGRPTHQASGEQHRPARPCRKRRPTSPRICRPSSTERGPHLGLEGRLRPTGRVREPDPVHPNPGILVRHQVALPPPWPVSARHAAGLVAWEEPHDHPAAGR